MKVCGVNIKFILIIFVCILASCAETQLAVHSAKRILRETDVLAEPKAQSIYKIGKPYQINGVWYYPAENYEYDEAGIASWYGKKFDGGQTANGEIYDMNSLTAAHRTLPMPSFVRVINLENGRSLNLKINDRGPFARGRIIDISRQGAHLLGFQKQGTAKVRVQILERKSREIKVFIKNQNQLSKVGTPLIIEKMPKPVVESKILEPVVANGFGKRRLESNRKEIEVKSENLEIDKKTRISSNFNKVSLNKVSKTHIYVQVGSFSKYDNASRLQAKLTPLGSVRLSQALIKGRDFYRVRIGPLSDVRSADKALVTVTNFGYRNAKIIVD